MSLSLSQPSGVDALAFRDDNRNGRITCAEADVGGLAVEAYPLRSGLGETAGGCRLHKKAQAVSAAPVAVAPRDVDGVDEGGGESLGAFHRHCSYHFCYHNFGKYVRIAAERQGTKKSCLSDC